MAVTYIIRGLNPETWRRFKTRVTRQGLSIRTVLIDFIEAYAAERYVVRAADFPTPHYLTAQPGVLTADPGRAETYQTIEAAGNAIVAARAHLGRPETLIIQVKYQELWDKAIAHALDSMRRKEERP